MTDTPKTETTRTPPRRIMLISDGTGETLTTVTKAAMVQFQNFEVITSRYKNVRTSEQIDGLCDEASAQKSLILFTMVSPELRSYMITRCRERNIPYVDILGPLLRGLGSHFGLEPRAVAGLLHDVNENYFRRIEAMEYTIQHDDGRDLTGLENADLVILGISRTSKTPLSMYLSHQGWKVANIPIINGFELPEELQKLDPRKVIGLTIDPEDLATIRRARLERLGQDKGGDYADLERVNAEIEYASDIFAQNRKWPVFNVTEKALEETASEIVKLMSSRRLVPAHAMDHLGPAVTPTPSGADSAGR